MSLMTDFAIKILERRARKSPAHIPEITQQLVKAGFEISKPAQFGDTVEGRGIYLGQWIFDAYKNPVEAYIHPDFVLRNQEGAPLRLNFDQAVAEVTKLNSGRRYGKGTESDLCKAIENNTYQEGDWVVAPVVFLDGTDGRDLLDAKIRPNNAQALPNRPWLDTRIVSSSEYPHPSVLPMRTGDAWFTAEHVPVRIAGGGNNWTRKDTGGFHVVPVCFYKFAKLEH